MIRPGQLISSDLIRFPCCSCAGAMIAFLLWLWASPSAYCDVAPKSSPLVPTATTTNGVLPSFPFRVTVVLQTRRDRVYAMWNQTPVRMNIRESGEFANGEVLEVSGLGGTHMVTNLSVPLLVLDWAKVRSLSETNSISPLQVAAKDLASGALNYRRVSVRGKVVSHEWMYFDDRYIEIILAEDKGYPFRVEVLHHAQARERMPIGTEVEFVGLSYTEKLVEEEGPVVQIDVKNLEECRVLQPAPWLNLERARIMVFGAAGFAVIGLLWFVRERKQIRRLRTAERAVRQLNVDLEKRVAERTAELQESETKFRALYESAGNAVLVQDEDRILDCNPATLRVFGYEQRSEIVGKRLADLAEPKQPDGSDSRTLAGEHIRQALMQGSHRFEWMARRREGIALPVEVFLTSMRLNDRMVLQTVIHDISERKRAEFELQRALAHEKELSELKSRFVSMVSHEFRNPLGIILSSAEILDAYLDRLPVEERRANIRDITQSSKHMAAMIEEVLLLGRVEAGKMSFRPVALDLGVLCGKIADEVKSATSGRGKIQLSVMAGMSEAMADENLLRHILTNLLINGVKYSSAQSAVEFSVEARKHLAIFRVRDRGIGIPILDQAQLFQAFHRGRNVGDTPGTGLGMVIVKHCVQLHGGKIAFDSREGQGTTFTVALPLFPAAIESADLEAQSAEFLRSVLGGNPVTSIR